jgi:uncharacterized delta-60 repeat protein
LGPPGTTLQSDGKIVVVGTTDFTGSLNYQFAVARYDVDGTLDNTFSGDGKATISFFGSYNAGHAVAIQGDGKIVVAGFAGNSFAGLNDGRFGVARLNSNGDLDTTFGNYDGGKSLADFGGGISNATGVVIDSLDRIVVAGSSDVGVRNDFAVVRFNTGGGFDNSFGINGDGQVTTDFSLGDDFGQSVTVDGSDNIIVSGQAGVPNGLGTFGLARYTSTGILDSSFSDDGKVTTDFFGYGSNALAVKATASGIVAAGYAQGKRSRVVDFALARFSAIDGSLDATFGTGGKVTTSFSGAADVASAVALDGNGDIVAAGQTADKNFALARYLD